MFTPDVAITGAQINPGIRKATVINWLYLLLSGRPFNTEMISINILEYVRNPYTPNSTTDMSLN